MKLKKSLHLGLMMMVAVAPLLAEGPVESKYKKSADALIDGALKDPKSLDELQYLCDHIGNRISGSESLNRAIAWSVERMKARGLVNVHTQPVMVPHWVRGEETATVTSPVSHKLHLIGIGNTVGTGAEGIDAEIVVVKDFDALKALPADAVKGKIVVYTPDWRGYGYNYQFRTEGADKAAALGAVAVLVRSATGLALQAPHTGTLRYSGDVKKIPAAAISVEDAAFLGRIAAEGGPVHIKLKMMEESLPMVESANVIGEIVGSEHPEEIVAVGGHIDSWDVGQGAQDDGVGVMASLEAVALIKKLDLHPKRTIRLVFWVEEESGSEGGAEYRKQLGADLKNHVAAIEMDGGAEAPVAIGYGSRYFGRGEKEPAHTSASWQIVDQIAGLLKAAGVEKARAGGGGADIEPLTEDGVAGFEPVNEGKHYFDWHHTEADTFDKVNPEDFRKNVATLAVLSYLLADIPERIEGEKAAPAKK